jgi:DNA polymerase bacteriophage-type
LYENVTSLASSALRGAIIAPKSKKLVISDLSGIEGRMLAWLAGEEWKTKAYYDFDAGENQYDMYELTYAKTFNIDPCDVDDDKRKLGKVLELAMGYGGGVGAFVTFANGYKVDLEDMAGRVWGELPERVLDEASGYWAVCVKERKTLGLSEKVFVACDSIKRLWREANPKIVEFWADLQDAVYQALLFDRVVMGKHFQVEKKEPGCASNYLPVGMCAMPGQRLKRRKFDI